MFQGSQSISMDSKGRMAIPSRYRDALAAACQGRVIITANPYDRCLSIYPEPQWKILKAQIDNLPSATKAARRLQRLVLGNATELEIDGNGRILLPPTLREYAALDKKLMLVGLGKKAELWSETSWNSLLDEPGDDDSLPAEIQSLAL